MMPAGDPGAISAFAGLVGSRGSDQLASFHLSGSSTVQPEPASHWTERTQQQSWRPFTVRCGSQPVDLRYLEKPLEQPEFASYERPVRSAPSGNAKGKYGREADLTRSVP
jgi:hypothetical protein